MISPPTAAVLLMRRKLLVSWCWPTRRAARRKRRPRAGHGPPSSASTRCRTGRRRAAPARLPSRRRPDRVPATTRAARRPGMRSSRRSPACAWVSTARCRGWSACPVAASSRASDEINRGWLSESSAITAVGLFAQSQEASTFTAAATTSSDTSPSGSSSKRRNRAPQPRSVSLPMTRPGAGPSPIFPARSTPSLLNPDGHCLRGVSSTPGRISRCLVSSVVLASTSALARTPVQLSQRPHRSSSVSSGSSSWPRRNAIRQSSVAW